jgi:hypothetical protein
MRLRCVISKSRVMKLATRSSACIMKDIEEWYILSVNHIAVVACLRQGDSMD